MPWPCYFFFFVSTHEPSSSSSAAVEDDDDRNALLKRACAIIEAVWRSSLVWDNSNGVLREMSEVPLVDGTIENLYTGGGGTDGLQFKSVLLRHQRYLISTGKRFEPLTHDQVSTRSLATTLSPRAMELSRLAGSER